MASGPERVLLELYRFIGGWGHRPLRPAAAWLALVTLVSWLILYWPNRFLGERFTFGGAYIDVTNPESVYVKYVARNALAFFAELDYGDIHNDGYALLLLTKGASTVLLVLMAMGVWSRLRR